MTLKGWHVVKPKHNQLNTCPTEWIKMPHPLLIFSQSDYLIQIVDINSLTKWQTEQIKISWLLLQKPTDLDLHSLQRQDISGFSRTRVHPWVSEVNISISEVGQRDNSVKIVFAPFWNVSAPKGKTIFPFTIDTFSEWTVQGKANRKSQKLSSLSKNSRETCLSY